MSIYIMIFCTAAIFALVGLWAYFGLKSGNYTEGRASIYSGWLKRNLNTVDPSRGDCGCKSDECCSECGEKALEVTSVTLESQACWMMEENLIMFLHGNWERVRDILASSDMEIKKIQLSNLIKLTHTWGWGKSIWLIPFFNELNIYSSQRNIGYLTQPKVDRIIREVQDILITKSDSWDVVTYINYKDSFLPMECDHRGAKYGTEDSSGSYTELPETDDEDIDELIQGISKAVRS